MSIVGILADDVDPMVSVMKVEKAPTETYADIGGLHEQVSILYTNIPNLFHHIMIWYVHYYWFIDSGNQRGRGVAIDSPRALRGHWYQAS
jgi:hypothetical protein